MILFMRLVLALPAKDMASCYTGGGSNKASGLRCELCLVGLQLLLRSVEGRTLCSVPIVGLIALLMVALMNLPRDLSSGGFRFAS